MTLDELKQLKQWSPWVGKLRTLAPDAKGAVTKQAVRRVRVERDVETVGVGEDGDPITTLERKVVSELVDVDCRHFEDWTTHADALAARARIDSDEEIDTSRGTGHAFMIAGTSLVMVDLDDCVKNRKIVSPTARRIVDELDSYTEFSASGTGIHVVIEARPIARKRFSPSGIVELIWYGNHIAFTEDAFHSPQKPIAERTTELLEIGRRELGWQ